MILVDFGDAMVETKQLSPGTRPDSLFHFGVMPGSQKQEVDASRLMPGGKPQLE